MWLIQKILKILDYYNIDVETNPFHIINRKNLRILYKDVELTKIFIDYDSEFDIKTQPIGKFLLDFINIDLSDYSDLKDFVFQYGFDILRNYDKTFQLFLYESLTEK